MKNLLYKLTATEVRQAILNREISAKEYINSCVGRVDQLEKKIHAWVHFYAKKALSQATTIDKKISSGKKIGLLAGIPIGVKDIFNTYDMPTQMGSPLWQGFMPGNDARVVFYLRQEDAVIPGKTITAEFGVHFPGPTVNPYNHLHTPGTSSSGSAAAVATYMVPLALGSQTAGSTLRPASYCGIFGFKPSFGLIPRTGMLKTTDTLDHVGLLGRSLDDIKLLFETLRVKGEDYPLSNIYLKRAAQVNPRVWKIAFVKGPKWRFAEAYAQNAIIDFVKKLSLRKDCRVLESEISPKLNDVHELHELIYDKCLSYYFKKESQNEDKVSKIFLEMVDRGKKISLKDFQRALKKQEDIHRAVDNFFGKFDIIINLTTGGEALPGLDSIDRPDNCLIWTFCGLPALSLPVFWGPNRLPFGVQIVARRYNDFGLLTFAKTAINKNEKI